MQRDEQIRQAKRLLKMIDARETFMAQAVNQHPVSAYTSADQATRERENLFRGRPNFIGLSCLLPKTGDFITQDFSGIPILLTRDTEGAVRAFMNVCRHRGAKVECADSGGGKRVFICPYHAWSYNLSGALVGRPREDAFAEVDRQSHGLVELPATERHGMIWVAAKPDAEIDVDACLGGLTDDMCAYGLDRYFHFETRVLRRSMNWKLVIDTFLETYHVNVLHTKTIAPIIHSDLATFDAFGPNLRMIAARKSIASLRNQNEADWDVIRHTAAVYVIFPNVVFVMQGDHVETWHVYPAGNGVDECVMYASLYTPEPAETESAKRYWLKNFDLLMRTVEQEDFPLAETMHANFYTGAQRTVVHGRNEPALAHFHQSIMAELAEGQSERDGSQRDSI